MRKWHVEEEAQLALQAACGEEARQQATLHHTEGRPFLIAFLFLLPLASALAL